MLRIVIAEDEADVRGYLVRAFQRYAPHVEVVGCSDGAEALAIIEAHGCDLLVSDQRMPAMTGLELLQAVRARGFTWPVVIISADASAETVALAAGASAFYYKPLNTSQIRELLGTWLPPEHPTDNDYPA